MVAVLSSFYVNLAQARFVQEEGTSKEKKNAFIRLLASLWGIFLIGD